MEKVNKRLTIVCSTCEAFSDMWSNQIFGLSKYWKNHPKFVFVSDSNIGGVQRELFHVKQGDFSERLLSVLHAIETDYILLTLDDYLLCSRVKIDKINYLIDFMYSSNASYMKLYKSRYGKIIDKKNKIRILPLKETYEVSLTPSIWKTTDLIKILEIGKNAWETEVLMTFNSRENNLNCFCCYDGEIYKYVDVVRKGKYIRSGYKYILKNNLYLSNRPIMPIPEAVKRIIITSVSKMLPRKLKNVLAKKFKIKSFALAFEESKQNSKSNVD